MIYVNYIYRLLNIMPIKCQVCQTQFAKLVPAHIKTHGISVAEYKLKFKDAAFVDINVEYYINKANIAHNFTYDYSLSHFNRTTDTVKIICKTHGIFEQKLNDHIDSKHGCPKCSHNYPYTTETFMFESSKRYGNKFSLISQFNGMKHPVSMNCELHGSFNLKVAEVHLRSRGGCPTCCLEIRLENLKPGNISKIEKAWLDSLNVPCRQEKIIIDNKIFLVDGFDPSTNTVYELYGSFWHGNPAVYTSDNINVVLKISFGELYSKTINRENIIKTRYNLITKWV